ncbi:MAG TPA: penicillin acylase family protein, partial [Actinomycetota bacterium]|nr:penicillin acylase family protein [Actinomycetota bacterium]
MRFLRGREVVAVALAALGAAGPLSVAVSAQEEGPVKPYGANDRGVTVLNVLPPGQGRYLNGFEQIEKEATGEEPEQNYNQIEMYDKMVQGAPDVTGGTLTEYFKDATFGVEPDDIEREYSPRDGVVVLRDTGYGVPHVYGTTRDDVMFGAGYVSAEDRLFMMDVLRHVGRG